MKVLITGATGFIGKYVIDHILKNSETQIIATSRTISNQSLENNFIGITYDISKFEHNENLFNKFQKPDLLIHLAWEGLPNYMKDFHITKNLPNHIAFLKNLIENGLQNITVVGTCFEYGLQEGSLSEDMPCFPRNYYALAKDTLRRFLEIYCKEKDVDFKWIRLFYMYGKGQNINSIIAQLDKAIDENHPVFNMSGGQQVRDYLPIQKVAQNIVNIALQNNVTGIINNCSAKPQKLIDFVENYLIQKNKKIKLNLGYYPYSPLEPMEFWGDNQKLKSIHGTIIK